MKKIMKVYELTAKLIKCSCCGSKMTEINPKTHNSRAMYKLNKDDYLCASTKCTKSYMTERFHRYENEGENYKGVKMTHRQAIHKIADYLMQVDYKSKRDELIWLLTKAFGEDKVDELVDAYPDCFEEEEK